MKLDATSDAKPVVLYDGGDLGISDCKRMQLSYLSWTAEADANSSHSDGDGGIPQVHQVKLVNHKNCQVKYQNEIGSVYIEQAGGGFDGVVGTSETCVVVAGSGSSHMYEGMGPCTGDLGLPLTAKVKGVQRTWMASAPRLLARR